MSMRRERPPIGLVAAKMVKFLWSTCEEPVSDGSNTGSSQSIERNRTSQISTTAESLFIRIHDRVIRHVGVVYAGGGRVGAGITLLPRPSKTHLAKLTGMSKSDVTRCFADLTATELNLLWQTADDLEAVLRLRGRSRICNRSGNISQTANADA